MLNLGYGGGGDLFHAEAGDLRGQLLPGLRTGCGASMSLGDVADFSMSPRTTRQISRDSWGGLPNCPPLLEGAPLDDD